MKKNKLWIILINFSILLNFCYGSPYIRDFEVNINKEYDMEFDVPDEYWEIPREEDSQFLQISQIIIKKHKHVIPVTQPPWIGGPTISPDLAVISLRIKFPHFIRNSRSLSLHDEEEGLVKMKTDKIDEALAATYDNLVKMETYVILESEDKLPQSTTPLFFTDIYNIEALATDIENKVLAISQDLEIITLSIEALIGGRISQTCSSNSDCITRGGECVDSRCRCSDRYEQTETTCKPDGLFLSPCQKTRECTGHNERCFNGFCYCQDRYEDKDRICVKKAPYGLNCTNFLDCEIDELQCKDSICLCKDVYYPHNKQCYLLVNYNEECELDGQCASSEHCSEEKRCTCDEGLEFFEGVGCTTRKNIGSACTITEECLGVDVRCTSLICACIDGKSPHVDGTNTCVRTLLTTSYPMELDSPWNPSYSNKNSAGYAAVAAVVIAIYEEANIPGFVEVLSVDLTESTAGKILSTTVFTAKNPDAKDVDRRRHVTHILKTTEERPDYDEEEAKQRLINIARPLIQESLKKVAMEKTIDYQLILNEAYDENQHSDPKSITYKKKVQSIKNMIINAEIAGLELIKHVQLTRSKDGHVAAIIRLKIRSSLESNRLDRENVNELRKRNTASQEERLLPKDTSVKSLILLEATKQLKYYM